MQEAESVGPDNPRPLGAGGLDDGEPYDTADGTRVIPLDDGGLELVMGGAPLEEAMPQQPAEFGENLALRMDPGLRREIGQEVLQWVDADEDSRRPWWQRLEEGLTKAGLIDAAEGAAKPLSIEGSSRVVHPLLTEAAVQFQARALEELFPSAGPVKCVPLGRKTRELEEQAQRVEDFMNYQMVTLDDSYFWDVDQMLFYLPFGGSAFKKTYWDRLRKQLRSRFVKADNILVPYGAQTNEEPRLTHRFTTSHNELLKMQRKGLYVDVAMTVPPPPQQPGLTERADDTQPSAVTFDGDHTMFECHCDFEIENIDQDRDYKGIAWPYTITVERESGEVMAIYRNWKANDADRNKRRWFSHYRYLPGLGYYGFGLFHAIGGLGEAATGVMRAFLDAAGFANFQGGFKSKDVRLKNGEIVLKMGTWQDVEANAEELQKAFYTPPFKEPSTAMPALLEIIVGAGQRFASTTEAMVGEGTNNVPVGTTVARIEQGSKVYTGIHRRLHRAAGEEFKMRAALNAEYVPEDGFPYLHGKMSRTVFQKDFDDRVDVVPVSDPNIFSSTQRIALAQASLQMAATTPGLYNQYEAHKRMHEALRTPDVDSILIDPDSIQSRDPVAEGQMVLTGKPIRAFLEQAHDAHLVVHMSQVQQFQGTPMGQQIVPVLIAHIAEHIALKYRLEMSQAIGVMLPDPNSKNAPPLPPEMENMIAMRAAQAIQAIQAQMAAQQAQQVDPQAAAAQADAQRKDKLAEADIARKDRIAESEQRRKDQAAQADMQRKAQEAEIEGAQRVLDQNGVTGVDPAYLVAASKELQKNLQDTLELIMRARAAGQQQFQPKEPLVEVQTS